jgi:hypothetical protein
MNDTGSRWVLAFDAACGKCRAISAVVSDAGAGKLEMLPLAHPDVQEWRNERFGDRAPWVPTLINASAGRVRVWTGPAMAVPLLRRLGPRSTVRVINALGRLQRAETATTGRTIDRKQFLRFGAGAVAAIGLVVAGKTPAFAATEKSDARAWVEANRDRLPETYDAVVGRPMAYRKAIYQASSPQVRSRLWVEQLRRYRAARSDLTKAQVTVLDEALTIASDHTTFDYERSDFSAVISRVDKLSESARTEFGTDAARDVLATLGPADNVAQPADEDFCNCAVIDSYCWGLRHGGNCIVIPVRDCGTLLLYVCDGLC